MARNPYMESMNPLLRNPVRTSNERKNISKICNIRLEVGMAFLLCKFSPEIVHMSMNLFIAVSGT